MYSLDDFGLAQLSDRRIRLPPQTAFLRLFVSERKPVCFSVYHPFQPYMMLKNATGFELERNRGEKERGKSPLGIADFLSSVSFFPPLCLCFLWSQLLAEKPDWLYFSVSFIGSREEGMSSSLSVSVSAQLLRRSQDGSHLTRCMCEKERQEERD
ncbi:hypothetical protein D9C73_020716 [Collichthys lucidus]|uniref:Uncharacterized protein n=1 Tax=Collichthys lucidus TaxID=240159 RepID=A0A4U5VEW2_COLLU|nr:hypothetical protein D9C73_020716 [Collichthys lucidus]